MDRQDENMPYLLQYEHIAWYEKGCVRILDRRIYPEKTAYVVCYTYQEVAQAIHDMVTQSAGPYTAVGMGMALAAYQARNLPEKQYIIFLEQAADCLSHARPTTVNRYGQITQSCLNAARQAFAAGQNPIEAIVEDTISSLNRRYTLMQIVGDYLADLIPDQGAILTQCFGETIIGTVIRAMRRQGKVFQAYCAETRPYLQGVRLTASCFSQMGIKTTVITDNMAAYLLEHERISLLTSAADTIALDGHIANKIGTLQLAILAKYYHVPYYVTGIPDKDKLSGQDIVIEQRDPEQVLVFQEHRLAAPEVQAIYPAFDVTPPELISGIVTDKGMYAPDVLREYFATETRRFY